MKLKHISGFAAIAAALTIVTLPAEAASLTNGSTVVLKNNNQGGALQIDPSTTGGLKFDFFGARTNPTKQPVLSNQGVTVVSGTGDFANTNNTPIARIKDLNLNATLNSNIFKLGSLPGFLTGLDVTGGTNNLGFNLVSFVYDKTTGIGKFKGTFAGGQVGLGTFQLGSAITNPAGNPIIPNDYNYTLSVTAVPTPVLLPGLLGLAAAALKKGKDEASEEPAQKVNA